MHFFLQTCNLLVSLKTVQAHFFSTLHPLSMVIFQLQQYWHLYCFTILGSTSTVIYSVKQRLLRNQPRSNTATYCAKDYKQHSLVQTIFIEPPNKRVCPEGWLGEKSLATPGNQTHVSMAPECLVQHSTSWAASESGDAWMISHIPVNSEL